MRREGWEERLARLVEEARSRAYELGVWDCFAFACATVRELTGADRWPEFAGGYRTREEARALIAQHGRSFRSAFDWFFGVAAGDVKLARRGDIVAYRDPQDAELHLGVCLGVRTAVLGPEGLLLVPTLECRYAWRIG